MGVVAVRVTVWAVTVAGGEGRDVTLSPDV